MQAADHAFDPMNRRSLFAKIAAFVAAPFVSNPPPAPRQLVIGTIELTIAQQDRMRKYLAERRRQGECLNNDPWSELPKLDPEIWNKLTDLMRNRENYRRGLEWALRFT